ncbi:hypothetical protein HYV70_02880 [Candidatus Uhrbacteria bacterium]|nr:hypothetical protein [Candidatus Uhrbacteria bacterium]
MSKRNFVFILSFVSYISCISCGIFESGVNECSPAGEETSLSTDASETTPSAIPTQTEATPSSISDSSDDLTGESACGNDEVFLAPGVYPVGETNEQKLAQYNQAVDITNFWSVQIPLSNIQIEEPGVCIQRYPFHGRKGGQWSVDGLAEAEISNFREKVLKPAGRELCSIGQLMVAMAGTQNWRYPYGNTPQTTENPICDINPEHPSREIGAFADCQSFGYEVHDFQVRTMWALVDKQGEVLLNATGAQGIDEVIATHPAIVCGGNARYAESFGDFDNFSCHGHPNDEATLLYPYLDDFQGRTCRPAVGLTDEQKGLWQQTTDVWYSTNQVGCYYDEKDAQECALQKGYDQK